MTRSGNLDHGPAARNDEVDWGIGTAGLGIAAELLCKTRCVASLAACPGHTSYTHQKETRHSTVRQTAVVLAGSPKLLERVSPAKASVVVAGRRDTLSDLAGSDALTARSGRKRRAPGRSTESEIVDTASMIEVRFLM